MGTSSTNVDYTGAAQVASNGTWHCDVVVPAFVQSPVMQLKLTDENTNTFIYPHKKVKTKASL